MTQRLLATAVLAGLYLLLLSHPQPLDAPIALAVAFAATFAVGASPLGGAPRERAALIRRVAATPALVGWVVGDIARGTVQVAATVLGLRSSRKAGEVEITVGRSSEEALVVTGVLLTVSPGSILLEADAGRGTLRVHALGADDPEALDRSISRLHRLVLRVVEG